MFSNREAIKHALQKYGIMILGCAILSFGLYNVHEQCHVTEGGVLGMTLFLDHWLSLSPSAGSFILNVLCYAVGFKFLGKAFLLDSLIAAVVYSLIYGLWELFPPILPSMAQWPLLAAIVGALFVGIGVGLVVRMGIAPSGDDALALVLAHVTKKNVGKMYLVCDLIVLALSLTYIPVLNILCSLVTVTISSWIIGRMSNQKGKKGEDVKAKIVS
jgi:uncharacterized membrane-anchored protein YitT (DUF2179 family)